MKRFIALAAVMVLATQSSAQQPYKGLQHRPIKALSDEQLADLRAGRGMGLALAAELNGYPGPVHVIELADQLSLSSEQRARVQLLYEQMRTEAVPLGERLIAQEQKLDGFFAHRTITAENLASATAQIGQTHAALRTAHLRYHLLTLEALTPEQVQRYSELRGYTSGSQGPSHHPGKHERPN
jgi:Spy/CpxP family protein refolding chaperone